MKKDNKNHSDHAKEKKPVQGEACRKNQGARNYGSSQVNWCNPKNSSTKENEKDNTLYEFDDMH